VGGSKLENDQTRAIARDCGQCDDDQDEADAIAIGRGRKHADMITSEDGLGKREIVHRQSGKIWNPFSCSS